MARRFYEPAGGGTELNLFIDPEKFVQADDQAALTLVQEARAASDGLRSELAVCKGFASLEDYDADLELQEWDLLDRLDYYSYENRTQSLTVRDGAWFTPEAIEAFCGEDDPNVAANIIDGTNNTFWRHNVNQRHSITFRLRGHPKRITKLRFRYGAAEVNREQLTNLDIRVSRDLSEIDEARNLRETGVNIAWPTGAGSVWVEYDLADAVQKARYIKLDFDTVAGNNDAQIREFAVRVSTRAP